MIPDAQVDEVRARADIVEIVGEVVQLKRSGKDFKANCPFHEERTPSFFVVPAKGFYNCFGCGESGDVFSFVMKRQGLDFVEAVKYVAARSGVEIREVSRGREVEDPYRHLYEANAFARSFFQDQLWDEAVGREARDYMNARGIGKETSESCGLGFAPDGWRGLRDAAAHHGITDEVLLEVGLLTQSERATEPYDRFRNRIVFPIESLGGKVLGFGGRVLGVGVEGSPKYVNSPESPIYHKGQVLYGLHNAKNHIRREAAALVVEGYMDAVSMAAVGIQNVVAPLGTALTREQAALLKRYAKRVLLLFDSDAAGIKATFRAGDVLLEAGLHPSVVTFPDGEDPDTIVQKEGAAGLRHYLEQAVDVLDRKLHILEERDYFSSIERTRSAVDRLLPTIRATRDPALRDIYVSKVAEKTGVRRETLEEELRRQLHAEPSRVQRRDGRHPTTSAPAVPRMGAQRKLLLLMVQDRDWVVRAAERVGPGDFFDTVFRDIFEALVEDPELTHAPEGMAPESARILESLLADPEELSQAHRVFDESLSRMRIVLVDRRLEELDAKIRLAGSDEEKLSLLREKADLGKERRDLGLDWSATAKNTLGGQRSKREQDIR
ncbi:MAG: DNA primase [Gemmatimonadota bacterium]|nr:MAG: DNA primase [Gemmatimonadota bacterium]